ncbi:hypothetical protein GRI89_08815 [Altererythrobacter salegens]|uniref:Tetratricopeptide repeat protein n=1 Tax=Croceibacterium salegens TaxID=1737568 RepID=A0A6I4SX04_9SPHN|nr:hypothetical protein [Croceibacterium salegens]MXO59640.1 hypothetical protein [Croceibacterium salegens]
MLRKSTHAPSRRFGSPLALALALAAGGVLGSAAMTAPAFAKEKVAKENQNSKAFADAYEPYAAIVNAEAGDFAAAKAMVPSVTATIENDQDRYVMGQSLISLGGKLQDTGVQKQGLELSLASGKTPPEQVGVFNYYLARFAAGEKNWPAARQYYQASADAGYTEGLPDVLIADTYFNNNETAQGLTYLSGLLDKRAAAGLPVDDQWIMRGLKVALDAKQTDAVLEYSKRLVSNNGTEKNWQIALQTVQRVGGLDTQASLDLLRLMRATSSMKESYEYKEYVRTAAESGLPAEVVSVLHEGQQAGVFQANEPFYTDNLADAEPRAAGDRKDVPASVDEARSSATGKIALGNANAFLSFGDYAQAEDMFKTALDKGVNDRQQALLRLGMSQVMQGKYDEGTATLGQVAGGNQAVAQMWIAYAGSKKSTGA